ncbi:putative PEP-binding protein [Candidatus Accumulibacter sp. ACC012]
MIETPSAVILIEHWPTRSTFFSVGSNDPRPVILTGCGPDTWRDGVHL